MCAMPPRLKTRIPPITIMLAASPFASRWVSAHSVAPQSTGWRVMLMMPGAGSLGPPMPAARSPPTSVVKIGDRKIGDSILFLLRIEENR